MCPHPKLDLEAEPSFPNPALASNLQVLYGLVCPNCSSGISFAEHEWHHSRHLVKPIRTSLPALVGGVLYLAYYGVLSNPAMNCFGEGLGWVKAEPKP